MAEAVINVHEDSVAVYRSRIASKGGTLRGAALKRKVEAIYRHLPDNLSYTDAEIDGEARNVCILDSDNLNEKTIISLPGEDISAGAYVDWMNYHWLVTERDPNTTIHTRAKMIQCNYLLKWVSESGNIVEQWCFVEDGTKLTRARLCVIVWRIGNGAQKRFPELLGHPESRAGHNAAANSSKRDGLKTVRIGQSAAKPRTEEGSTTIPDVGVGASVPKWGTLNRSIGRHGEDIVCTLWKHRGALVPGLE